MTVELQRYKQLLRTNNHILTGERQDLFEALQKHGTLSIKELVAVLPGQHHVTVYRNIKLFEQLGIITRLRLGWHSKLELSDAFQHHHHHLSCLKCGKVVVLRDNPVLEKEIAAMSDRHGFSASDHQLEIRGVCAACHN